ncbi:hypothetical protein SAMN05192574_101622 [Mucilaginibacter gossypiicola]|uniref:Uncharacterized protein n=1 Tax=Mucilaginibacter gossypiicola TaxID=551995 RepID=A0A1H8AQD3_9SPHI|nr:hypothetical protein SAMN05192574_101622 [Mucilaginibacter gossypiicola]
MPCKHRHYNLNTAVGIANAISKQDASFESSRKSIVNPEFSCSSSSTDTRTEYENYDCLDGRIYHIQLVNFIDGVLLGPPNCRQKS